MGEISEADSNRKLEEAKEKETEALSLLALLLATIAFALGGEERTVTEAALPFALSLFFLLISLGAGYMYSKRRIATNVQQIGNIYGFISLLVGILIIFVLKLRDSESVTMIEEMIIYSLIGSAIILAIIFSFTRTYEKMGQGFLWYYMGMEEDDQLEELKDNKEREEKMVKSTESDRRKKNTISKHIEQTSHEWRKRRGVMEFLEKAPKERLQEKLNVIREPEPEPEPNIDDLTAVLAEVLDESRNQFATARRVAAYTGLDEETVRLKLNDLSRNLDSPVCLYYAGYVPTWRLDEDKTD